MKLLENFAPGVGETINTEKFCYHYTSLETAIEYIFESSTLRFNPLCNVNDPKESNVNGWMGGSTPVDKDLLDKYVDIQREVAKIFHERVKVFCACRDRAIAKTGFDRGHVKPRMWAHYGQNGRGVCLVFDKIKLVQLARKEFDGLVVYGNVEYTDNGHLMLSPPEGKLAFEYDLEYLINNRFKNHNKELLLTKHLDWEAENEFRISLLDNSSGASYLHFSTALEAIIVGHNFPKAYCPIVGSYANQRNIYAGRLKWGAGSISHSKISGL